MELSFTRGETVTRCLLNHQGHKDNNGFCSETNSVSNDLRPFENSASLDYLDQWLCL